MATTYTPIATTTLGSAQANISFGSIPSTYTDLVLVLSVITASNDQSIYMQFNSDTGTNYSYTYLYGNGTTAASGRNSNIAFAFIGGAAYGTSTTKPSTIVTHIQNYANTTTYKTAIARGAMQRDDGNGEADAQVNLWRNTAAINTVLVKASSGNLAIGTTATLYGIKAA